MVARRIPNPKDRVRFLAPVPNRRTTMWTLVFIVFIGGKLESKVKGTYTTMYECFDAREALSYEVGKGNGYFNPGSQAVCVYREDISV